MALVFWCLFLCSVFFGGCFVDFGCWLCWCCLCFVQLFGFIRGVLGFCLFLLGVLVLVAVGFRMSCCF